MSETNLGNQEIIYQYNQVASSSGFNKLLRNFVRHGIYSGADVSFIGNTITLEPFRAYFNIDNSKGVLIKTTLNVEQTVSEIKDYFTMRFLWFDVKENWIDFEFKNELDLTDFDIILCKINYSGSDVSSLDTSYRTLGFFDENYNIVSSQTFNNSDIFNSQVIFNDLVDFNNDAEFNKNIIINSTGRFSGKLLEGYQIIDLTTGDVTLTESTLIAQYIILTGSFDANRNLTLPLTLNRKLIIKNNTVHTGTVEKTITVKGATGASFTLPVGETVSEYYDFYEAYCDGSNWGKNSFTKEYMDNLFDLVKTSAYQRYISSLASELNVWTSVAYGNAVFVSVANSGTNRVMRSTNYGVSWSAITPPGANSWHGITYGNNTFVAVSYDGTNRVMRSTDYGVSWGSVLVTLNSWYAVVYGGGVFISVGILGTNRTMRSTTDGVSWTTIAASELNAWRDVTYGNGVFVAVSADGTNRVMRSTDLGLTWQAIAATELNSWFGIAYGNGVFVAVAETGTNRVMRSTDLGLTWSPILVETNQWQSIAYGNGVFVAVAISGTNRVMKSTDLGLTWQAIAAAEANNWYGVKYGNGSFVSVAGSGTNRVMRSEYFPENIYL